MKTFRVLFPFCGLGAGALGFLRASVSLFGVEQRFESAGGIDFDAAACADFERLTKSPALCADVSKLTAEKLRAFAGIDAPDVVFSSPPCLPAYGQVLTPSGPVRIDSLRAGHMVLTHRGRYRRVVAVGAHLYSGEMFGLRLNGTVDTQEFTAEHPLWVRRVVRRGGRSRALGDASFVRASDVRVGDRVGFPVPREQPGCAATFIASFGNPQEIMRGGHRDGEPYAKPQHTATVAQIHDLREHAESASLWFLVGAYLGDGYRRVERNEVIYCVGDTQGQFAQQLRTALAAVGLRWREDMDAGPKNSKIHVSARHLCTILGSFGDGAETKTIPEVLFGLERAALDALVDGYRAADGSESAPRTLPNGRWLQARWRIASVGLPLLRGMQRLLLRRGEFASINIMSRGGPSVIEGRSVMTRPCYELMVRLDPTKRTVFEFTEDTVWVRVRSIAKRAATEPVWNLEVDEDNTFCAPLMATHNCQGYSGLMSEAKSKEDKYQALNELVLTWTRLMLEAWPNTPPKLVLIENVPRIETRGKKLLTEVKRLLRKRGYVFHASAHDCGEIGGLAQHRQRYLLVARHAPSTPALLYQPAKRRVRGCGEVLSQLPLPGTPSAGPLHELPKISTLNWIRLALIPPGGDWRAIEGALERRRFNNVMRVIRWDGPVPAINGGTGPTSGAAAVADPRIDGHNGTYGVRAWGDPAGVVAGASRISNGTFAVADPRVAGAYHGGVYGVRAWGEPSGAVCGESSPSNGAFSVADPRLAGGTYKGKYEVQEWDEPSRTVIGGSSNGSAYVADPRVESAYPRTYGVLGWSQPSASITGNSGTPGGGPFSVADERITTGGWNYTNALHTIGWDDPARTVTGGTRVGAGAQSVCDPRLGCAPYNGAYGVVGWHGPAGTITASLQVDNGPAAVADPRVPGCPALRIAYYPHDARNAPPWPLVLPTEDGTWHRPLTTLELAALQGLPTTVDGAPLTLTGTSSTEHRRRIGNAVPVPAAEAIARQMLITLANAAAGAFALSGEGGDVWVRPGREALRAGGAR